jgi:hypothetical protein
MGRSENGARKRAPHGVCRAGWGDREAIEPAGGVSPLRGGAEGLSYPLILAINYRS